MSLAKIHSEVNPEQVCLLGCGVPAGLGAVKNTAEVQALTEAYAGAIAAAPSEALGDSQVVIVATGYADAVAALQALGSLESRIVLDITNPLTPDYMGLAREYATPAAEEIASPCLARRWSRRSTPCWR